MSASIGIIPARYASTRFPGKPLKEIAGKTVLQRVWERSCAAASLSRVLVATDDSRIAQAAQAFGAEVAMTRSDHSSGSDRIAEVVRRLKQETGLVVNIQGDMPFINPQVIDDAVAALEKAPESTAISTVATPITSEEEFMRPSAVKVVLDGSGRACYFSRSPIPYWRDRGAQPAEEEHPLGLKHIGLYVYRPEALLKLTALPRSLLEEREQLEQLRALSNGMAIQVVVVKGNLLEPSIEIDTPEDLARAEEYCRRTGI